VDGSRLVVTDPDALAVHIWELRAIRRQLAGMGLNWDGPAYPEIDPAGEDEFPPPLRVVVDLGAMSTGLAPLLEQSAQFQQAGNPGDAIGLLRQAARLAPNLAEVRNNLAWLLVTAPERFRNPPEAVEEARCAVGLVPGEQMYLNTLGVALYRAGNFSEAITTLGKSLTAGKGRFDGLDLFFLAMAHHQLGHGQEAKSCFERAVHWLAEQQGLSAQYTKELASFRTEAEAVLAGRAGGLPEQVFAVPQ
jgi:hypothetical protein